MQIFSLADIAEQGRSERPYTEFLRVPAMSAGVYVLPAGAADPQQPHTEDELYIVLRGRARIQVAEEDAEVGPGVAVFVPANVVHRFHSIEEDLSVLVLFAPAEYSQASSPQPSE